MKKQLIYISLLTYLALTGCNDFLFFGSSNPSDNLSEMSLEDVAIAIDNEVGKAKADSISQCDIMPIGAKPCGGSWGYLVYSKKMSDEASLKELVDKYYELDEIRNKEEGLASTCDVAQPPELTLENGYCKGKGVYAWNPGFILKRNGIQN